MSGTATSTASAKQNFNRTQKVGQMSQATQDALNAIHVRHVSQAKEYEDFKQLPKFNHVPMGVIHPTNRRKVRDPVRPTPDMEKQVNISPLKLRQKPDMVREIPENL